MSGNGGGSFAAILLSIPLTAVALMSVFGIPQLSKVTSSFGSDPDSEVDVDEFEPRSRTKRRAEQRDELELEDAEDWNLDEDAEPSFGRSKSKLSRPKTILSDSRASRDSGLESRSRDSLVTRGKTEDEFGEEFAAEPSRSAATNPFAPTRTESGSPRAGGKSNFAEAIQRLTALGVDRFHLEPGLSSGQFLFVCIVDSAAASGAVHRFEAEAREPAAAVEDVIQQISDWKSESKVLQASAEEPVR